MPADSWHRAELTKPLPDHVSPLLWKRWSNQILLILPLEHRLLVAQAAFQDLHERGTPSCSALTSHTALMGFLRYQVDQQLPDLTASAQAPLCPRTFFSYLPTPPKATSYLIHTGPTLGRLPEQDTWEDCGRQGP